MTNPKGAPSEWARERARALRKQLCKGRDPLLTNVRVYPDSTAEIEDVLARALDAAMAEEREAAIKIAREYCESAYAAGNREAEDTAERIEAAIRARGEEASHE